jgi:hypothetical protein
MRERLQNTIYVEENPDCAVRNIYKHITESIY